MITISKLKKKELNTIYAYIHTIVHITIYMCFCTCFCICKYNIYNIYTNILN